MLESSKHDKITFMDTVEAITPVPETISLIRGGELLMLTNANLLKLGRKIRQVILSALNLI